MIKWLDDYVEIKIIGVHSGHELPGIGHRTGNVLGQFSGGRLKCIGKYIPRNIVHICLKSNERVFECILTGMIAVLFVIAALFTTTGSRRGYGRCPEISLLAGILIPVSSVILNTSFALFN